MADSPSTHTRREQPSTDRSSQVADVPVPIVAACGCGSGCGCGCQSGGPCQCGGCCG
ncbi:hypothetical protein [Streptomyces sp. NPDC051776]|uniref:hypothetical protein n=1 Tax=Streptomyces sp. NPDC051776 TaxID=3155414 RepID=UPI0034414FCA